MNEIMKRPNKTLWMVLGAIPVIGGLLVIGGWLSIYRSLQAINPQTTRSIGKDIGLSIITCGLFGLALPYLIIKDTQEGCSSLGIQAPDYTGHVYGLIVVNVILSMGLQYNMGDEGLMLSYILGGIVNAAVMHFYLEPFVIIADAYNE